MIIGYARVSTDKREQDISIEDQVLELQQAGCDRVIAERRSAYKELTRPGWGELLSLVASGKVTKVITRSLSRMSRKGEDVSFLRMCARKNIEVVFIDGTPANVADPSAKLMTGVLSLVNEVDSQIKSINIRNGLARRKAQGHYACGRVPYGYAYDGSQVVAHPEDFAKARQLWDQLAEMEFNMSGTIRRFVLDWSPRGLGRWIENPMLRGIVNNEPGRVPALITWDEWQAARDLIEARRINAVRAPRVIRPFSCQIKCGSCGHALHYGVAYGKRRLKCTHQHCANWGRGLAEFKVRQQVIDEMRAAAARLGHVAAAPTPAAEPGEMDARRQQISQLEALQAQGVPGLGPTIEAMKLELLVPPPATSANWAGYRGLFLRPGALEAATDEELRAVVLEFVAEIIYVGNPNRVEIRLRDGPGGDPA